MNNNFLNWTKRGTWIGLVVGALALLQAGCASKNVNPPKPHAGTGYVDLVSDDDELYWQVDEIDTAGEKKQIFQQFEPLNDRVLRLALKPGQHQLRVTFLNHAIAKQGNVELEVRDGQVTPVRVILVEAGTTLTENREVRVGGTAYGRYGRGTKIRAGQTVMYQVSLEPETPLPYKPKNEMAYANPPAQ